jgi:GT2 family glycosyltransferase
MKRLDIIVLNWNGLTDTLALLDSLARCRPPEGWRTHVMVVDNGSTDGSVERLSQRNDIELLPMGRNLRFAGGNNAGIRHALEQGADAVMLLNNDTEADPAMLERLILALEQDPEAGAAAPLIYYAPPTNRIWYAGGRVWPWLGLSLHRGLRQRDEGQFRSVEPTGYLTGCCLLAPRETWERVGMLDEHYYIYAEDADWSLRAREAGYRLLFVPTARLWHKVSASAGRVSAWKIYHRLRANLTLSARHAHGLGRLTWIPASLAAQAVFAVALLLKGHAAAAAAVPRAFADALRGIPPSKAMP